MQIDTGEWLTAISKVMQLFPAPYFVFELLELLEERETERERKRTGKGRDTVHFILPPRLEREFLSPPTESEKVLFFFFFLWSIQLTKIDISNPV